MTEQNKNFKNEELFENLYQLYELSRYTDTVEKEFFILEGIDEIADSMGLYSEFMDYLDNRLAEEGVLID